MDTVFKGQPAVVIVFIFMTHTNTMCASGFDGLNLNPYLSSFYNNGKDETYWNLYDIIDLKDLDLNRSIYYSRRKTPQEAFNTTTIRIAAVLQYVHDVDYTFENGSYVFTGGYVYESFKYISDSYKLDTISFKGENYASAMNDPNISDMGTMLMNDECDVAISLHEYSVARLSKFSFLHPHYASSLCAFFIQPPTSSIRDIYHYVFTFDTWMAILGVWILAIFTIWGITYVKKITSALQDNENQSFVDIFLWIVGAATQNETLMQKLVNISSLPLYAKIITFTSLEFGLVKVLVKGLTVNPEWLSLKIAVLCTLLTGLVIYLVYSAAIVSILAWDVVPIKNVSDMTSSEFTFYINNESISPNAEIYMQTLRDDVPYLRKEGKIIRTMKPGTAFKNAVMEDNAAFFSLDDHIVRKIIGEYPVNFFCDAISSLLITGPPITQAMIVQKGSPWKEYLNIKLVWEMNNGILHRIRTTYGKLTTFQCLRDPQSQHKVKSLDWKDIFSAVITLIILYVFSLVCFFMETLFAVKYHDNPSFV